MRLGRALPEPHGENDLTLRERGKVGKARVLRYNSEP
jgi:hypothetical protein